LLLPPDAEESGTRGGKGAAAVLKIPDAVYSHPSHDPSTGVDPGKKVAQSASQVGHISQHILLDLDTLFKDCRISSSRMRSELGYDEGEYQSALVEELVLAHAPAIPYVLALHKSFNCATPT